MYLNYACEQEPESVIYKCNYDILKWVCGLWEESEKPNNILIQKFPSKDEGIFFARSEMGLLLIDKLTNFIV